MANRSDDEKPPIFNGPRDPHGFGIEVPPVTRIGPFTVGHVESIHGEGGRPCPEYIPTRFELEILARHWADVLVGRQLDFEVYGQTGSTEIREIMYSEGRLDAIAALLGDAVVRKLFEAERGRQLDALTPEGRRQREEHMEMMKEIDDDLNTPD